MSSAKANTPLKAPTFQGNFPETELDKATIRFAGDSGDGNPVFNNLSYCGK